ncbi:MAG TPA: dihydroorotate dehydrogenase (quinone), partial [Solirubrobacteraceae bacterium]|nr:dihydroorotate dehydrogenase (quinone) [Solirubrobacteraceae bacterium]
LAPVADFLVINVSSPNTPGLRDLQTTARLRELIAAVRTEIAATAATGRGVPLLVKISPDLADEDIDAIADLALETGLDGIVAVNTTTTRDGLLTPATDVEAIGAGGLSGAPLAGRSSAVLRRLRDRLGDRVVLISVGGIDGPEEAWARIAAGATLVQAYTGFVYGGPLWPARVNRGLARLVSAAGHATIADAIGTAAGSGEARDAPRPGAR